MKELLNGYTQITENDLLFSKNADDPKIKGKVVENCGFVKQGTYGPDSDMFLITFTDKTYIMLGAYMDNYNDPELVVKRLADISEYGDGFIDRRFRFNNGKMTTETYIEMLMKFGLWTIDENKLKEVQERHQNLEKEKLHARYLELKEMFEPDEPRDEK